MGCRYFDLGNGKRFHIPEHDDSVACLCTFPHNDGEKLDAGRVEALAILGAAVVLSQSGEWDDSPEEFFCPENLPKWVRAEIVRVVEPSPPPVPAPAEACGVCRTKAAGLPTPGYIHDAGCPERVVPAACVLGQGMADVDVCETHERTWPCPGGAVPAVEAGVMSEADLDRADYIFKHGGEPPPPASGPEAERILALTAGMSKMAAREKALEEALREAAGALAALKVRIHYIGMPSEPVRRDGAPDWRGEIAVLEAALTAARAALERRGE